MHSTFFPDCFYRVSIKGLCVRDGKILLIREAKKMSGKWELPGGGLDFGEDMRAALKREIQEEMGVEVIKISEKPVYIWTHRYENNSRNVGWYYSLVITFRIEFKELNFTPSEECEALGFFDKEEIRTLKYGGQTQELIDLFNPDDFKDTF
jgi:8-oxo-dGTP diphosphatase